jgi:hypothetical protein
VLGVCVAVDATAGLAAGCVADAATGVGATGAATGAGAGAAAGGSVPSRRNMSVIQDARTMAASVSRVYGDRCRTHLYGCPTTLIGGGNVS